ncbi:MAG TPA: lysophospholipid acyltransferase family protein [Vicinamibacteria bacterium]|nr:lysophospholipid acyltransferase family protein [Vicinamibacteria bacterium]
MRHVIVPLVEALFRIVFEYDCVGEELVPDKGPAIVAANHPSYLDPVLLSLQVRRPIRFMAWEGLFRVPVLGTVIRAFGAFPVDTKKGQGRKAYEEAKALVLAGEVVGMFPEGKRSRTAWMEPALREGVARLAWETGAPLVPATITGAFRAWPYFQRLPEPARIRVRYHEPIDPTPYRALPEAEGIEGLLVELRARVERTLMPGVKADLRITALYAKQAPWPRWREAVPAFGLVLLVFWKTRSWRLVLPAYAYILYLLADVLVIPSRRLAMWIRNASPVYFLLFYGASVLEPLGLPRVQAQGALLALVTGAFFPYLYERGRVTEGFIQGMVAACLLELGALRLFPVPFGPHVALPLFAAAYAWERRTVYWRYTAPLLVAYAIAIGGMFGTGLTVLPHVITGLLAWLVVRFLPAGRPVAADVPEPTAVLGLGLLDPPEPDAEKRDS